MTRVAASSRPRSSRRGRRGRCSLGASADVAGATPAAPLTVRDVVRSAESRSSATRSPRTSSCLRTRSVLDTSTLRSATTSRRSRRLGAPRRVAHDARDACSPCRSRSRRSASPSSASRPRRPMRLAPRRRPRDGSTPRRRDRARRRPRGRCSSCAAASTPPTSRGRALPFRSDTMRRPVTYRIAPGDARRPARRPRRAPRRRRRRARDVGRCASHARRRRPLDRPHRRSSARSRSSARRRPAPRATAAARVGLLARLLRPRDAALARRGRRPRLVGAASPPPDALARSLAEIERGARRERRSRSPTRASSRRRRGARCVVRRRPRCARGRRSCSRPLLVARSPHSQTIVPLPSHADTIVVLDLSASIGSDTYSRIGATLASLARSRGRYGLVVFSGEAYEALPPGTPAEDLAPLVRYFVPSKAPPGFAPTYPAQPVDGRRSAPGRESRAGSSSAHEIALAGSGRRPAVVLVSDLDDDPGRPAAPRLDRARLPPRRHPAPHRRAESVLAERRVLPAPRRPVDADRAGGRRDAGDRARATTRRSRGRSSCSSSAARSRSPRTSSGRRGSSGSPRDESPALRPCARARRARRPRRAARRRRSRLAADVRERADARRRRACRGISLRARLLGRRRRATRAGRSRSSVPRRRSTAGSTTRSASLQRARTPRLRSPPSPAGAARARRRRRRCSACSRSATSPAAADATRARRRPRSATSRTPSVPIRATRTRSSTSSCCCGRSPRAAFAPGRARASGAGATGHKGAGSRHAGSGLLMTLPHAARGTRRPRRSRCRSSRSRSACVAARRSARALAPATRRVMGPTSSRSPRSSARSRCSRSPLRSPRLRTTAAAGAHRRAGRSSCSTRRARWRRRSRRAAPTRLDRAVSAAAALRASIPNVEAGIATLTDRVLPDLLPVADVPRSTPRWRAVGIDEPAAARCQCACHRLRRACCDPLERLLRTDGEAPGRRPAHRRRESPFDTGALGRALRERRPRIARAPDWGGRVRRRSSGARLPSRPCRSDGSCGGSPGNKRPPVPRV